MWQQFLHVDANGSHSYFVYTPKTYRVGSPVPLIVMLHGCRQTAEDFAIGTSMDLLAEQHGFVLLYPQQTGSSNHRRCWNWFLPTNQQRGSGEPASIVGMIKSVRLNTARWLIDPARIYVAGLSAGACMAAILGATYPDLFAAIGVHSGLGYQAATNVNSALRVMRRGGADPCQLGNAAYTAMSDFSRIVPAIVFHGTRDMTVVPANGDQVVQQWMQTNHLASKHAYTANFNHPTCVTRGQVLDGYSYVVATWNTSNGDEVQAYWKIDGMGHAWSGGNPAGSYTDSRGPSASVAMYNFFMAHPMRRAYRQSIISQKIKRHHTLADFFRKHKEGVKRNTA
ncbi:MAG TPA: PHB depolymerase family esterase [Ktedonobacteraceae bacterium]|nr:PHB depolymerase family esterase [Ktedonobacteraceae bacterium]